MNDNEGNSRRLFLGTMVGAATAASLPLGAAGTAAHRCFFDFPQHKKGAGLVHILNYVATYKDAYGADIGDINSIGTFYAIGPNSSIAMGFNDDMWSKYRLGEYLELDDPQTGKAAARNLFYKTMDGDEVPRVGPLGPFADASISSLSKNFGTTFLMCNNALMAVSMDLERVGRGKTDEIYADLKANLIDEVHLIPAMVIAIEKAQAAGIAYNKQ